MRLILVALRRALPGLILIFGLLFGLDRCSPDYPEVAQKGAIRDSFDERSVAVSGARGLLLEGYHRSVVDRVTANVHNSSRARIYDLWSRARLAGEAPQSRIEVPMEERQRVSSTYHYGYVEPGQSISVELDSYPTATSPALTQAPLLASRGSRWNLPISSRRRGRRWTRFQPFGVLGDISCHPFFDDSLARLTVATVIASRS